MENSLQYFISWCNIILNSETMSTRWLIRLIVPSSTRRSDNTCILSRSTRVMENSSHYFILWRCNIILNSKTMSTSWLLCSIVPSSTRLSDITWLLSKNTRVMENSSHYFTWWRCNIIMNFKTMSMSWSICSMIKSWVGKRLFTSPTLLSMVHNGLLIQEHNVYHTLSLFFIYKCIIWSIMLIFECMSR